MVKSVRVMKLRPLKETVSITIDGDVLKNARLLAEEEDRSLSQYINLILKRHIEKLKLDEKLR